MSDSNVTLGRLSSRCNELSIGDVCRYDESKWIGRIWIKLKFFFLQHKGWVTTKKIKQLVQTLGKDKETIKLQTLHKCLGAVKGNQKSVCFKIDGLFSVVWSQAWDNPFVIKEFNTQTIDKLREYEDKIIKLVVPWNAKIKADERKTLPESRSYTVTGKLISVSDKPVPTFTETKTYRVEIETKMGAKEFYFIDDGDLKNFNRK